MAKSTYFDVDDTYEPIEEFYSGKSVLITGGTGFIGKVLIEKLVYSCPNLSNVYVLVRERKNVLGDERVRRILESKLFTRLKKEKPESLKKIIPVVGDVTLPNLGMAEEDKAIIFDKVSVVFHLAATIRFNEPLKQAMNVNVEGTRNMVLFSKKIKDLQAFIYMSTAFGNTDKLIVEEIVYPPPMEIDDVYKFIEEHGDDDVVVKDILYGRPNTYTFTKALTEPLVAEICGDMPTIIVRPSVVVAAMHEPYRGWIDTWLGPTPALDMVARGWLKCLYGKKDYAFDIIPVDYVINATIVAAARYRRSRNILVYNCCTSTINKLSLNKVYNLYTKESVKVGYNDIPLIFMLFTKSLFIIQLITFIFQMIPAYILDFILVLRRKPTNFLRPSLSTLIAVFFEVQYPRIQIDRYVKTMNRLNYYLMMIKFFSSRNWFMVSTRLRDLAEDLDQTDQQKFPCNPAKIVWREYIPAYFSGVLSYLVNNNNTEKIK